MAYQANQCHSTLWQWFSKCSCYISITQKCKFMGPPGPTKSETLGFGAATHILVTFHVTLRHTKCETLCPTAAICRSFLEADISHWSLMAQVAVDPVVEMMGVPILTCL